MIDLDKWHDIFSTLQRHKLRTLLTVAGVFWGMLMLTLLLGVSGGLRNGVNNQFRKTTNTLWIWVNSPTQFPYQGYQPGRSLLLHPDDLDAVRRSLPGVALIHGQNSVGLYGGPPLQIIQGNRHGSYVLEGGFAGMDSILAIKIIKGRAINHADEAQLRKMVVIGNRVREQLFPPDAAVIGASMLIGGLSFTVAGVFRSLERGSEQQQEEKIYLPNSTLRHAFNQSHLIGNFVIVPKPGISATALEQEVVSLLAKRHRVSPEDTGVFGAYNIEEEFNNLQRLLTGVTVFSWIVALGTLAAGMISVSNIMLIVVQERTREIGVRKALGATPRSVVLMIVQESVLLSSLAGYAGLVAGASALSVIARLADQGVISSPYFSRPHLDLGIIFTALIVLITAGGLSAWLPASSAAAVNPVTVLQDE